MFADVNQQRYQDPVKIYKRDTLGTLCSLDRNWKKQVTLMFTNFTAKCLPDFSDPGKARGLAGHQQDPASGLQKSIREIPFLLEKHLGGERTQTQFLSH